MSMPAAAAPAAAEVSPEHILEVGMGFWASKTLLSAVEMEVFTQLAGHPQDLEALQLRSGLHPRAARDFFDALVALGFLERKDGVYSNTPHVDAFLDKGKPAYLGGMLEMANARLYGFWGDLTEGLRTGQPQNEAKHGGAPFFEALYADPARLKRFTQAMSGLSTVASGEIASRFDWSAYRTFADIGTAQGETAVQIAQANPHLTGYGSDLPELGPIFEEHVAEHGLTDRLKFVPGDFFADDLPAADVLVMGHILHDWGLEEKRTLIGKAYDALPAGGALIVYEAIIDEERSSNVFGLLMSLNMLIETPGGFDYTASDCTAWMRAAGFSHTRAEHLAGPDSMVVAIK